MATRTLQVFAGLRVIRVDAQGLLKVSGGFGDAALLSEQHAEFVMRVGVVCIQPDDFLVMPHRFNDAALLRQHKSQVAVRVGVAGLKLQ